VASLIWIFVELRLSGRNNQEIINGTFLDGFEETSASHPLPPEILLRLAAYEKRNTKCKD